MFIKKRFISEEAFEVNYQIYTKHLFSFEENKHDGL